MKTEEIRAIAHELGFWKEFVKTERFRRGWASNTPNPELRDDIRDFVQQKPHQQLLDVGSGVVSILHGLIPAENMLVTDPLGDLYALIYDYERQRIKQPQPLTAEELPFENQFDIAHISNALDHTQNPRLAFERLLRAVKPGGYLIVQGFEREATFEKWQGFHQHDVFIHDGKLAMDAKDGTYVFTAPNVSTVHASTRTLMETGRMWLVWIGQKAV